MKLGIFHVVATKTTIALIIEETRFNYYASFGVAWVDRGPLAFIARASTEVFGDIACQVSSVHPFSRLVINTLNGRFA
jgi:hypothetical protein